MSKEARIGINVFVVAAAIGLGLYLTRAPWKIYGQQKAAAVKSESEMRAKEAERAAVARKLAALDSPAGQEVKARENDFLRPGEVRIDPAR